MSKGIIGIAALLWAVAGVPPVQSRTPSWDVSGTIVDEAGKPLAEAELARYFMLTQGKFFPYEQLKADAQGKFAGRIQPYKLPMTYIALNKERNLGACVTLTEQSVKAPVRIVLKPLAEVSFQVKIEDGYEPTSMNTSIACPDTGTVVVLSYDAAPYKIPEGKYELKFFSLEVKSYRKPFTTGIQAIGLMGRSVWIKGLMARAAPGYQPRRIPRGTPAETAIK